MKTPQYQKIYILCLLALGMCAGTAGTAILARWQAERTVGADARLLLDQSAQRLESGLRSWNRAVVMVRDALDKAPALTEMERGALARSVQDQTPQMLGIGWMGREKAVRWWMDSDPAAQRILDEAAGQARQRAWLHTFLNAPSAWLLFMENDRPVMVMVEPLRARAHRPGKIVTVFDLRPLLEDMLGSTPARLTDSGRVLYQSTLWMPVPEGREDGVESRPVRFAGQHWMLEAQRGTGAVFPLFWLMVLLSVLGLAAMTASGGIVWAVERLRRMATTDELTGLPNRRYFLERWEQEFERARRYNRDLSCLMVDVNGFKHVNDQLGHQTGDRVLQQVAHELKGHLRQSDVLARFGGDEFIVALPETPYRSAEKVAQKLRQIEIGGFFLRPVHLSVGVSHQRMGESAEEIIRRADADLYATRRPGWHAAEESLATGTYGIDGSDGS